MINGKFMIPSHSDKLGIDNREVGMVSLKEKLREEFEEVMREENPKELAREVLDLMTMCANILYKLNCNYLISINGLIKEHYLKLKNRGWKAAGNIYFLAERKIE